MQERYRLLDSRLVEEHGQVMFICYLGVAPAARGRGLGQRLARRAVETAARQGYRVVYCESSGGASQALFKKALGFQVVWEVAYSRYRYKGEPIFACCSQKGHPSLQMLELWLRDRPQEHGLEAFRRSFEERLAPSTITEAQTEEEKVVSLN